MKYTKYFLYTRKRIDRQKIKMEWIQRAFNNPVKEEYQSDGRIRRWVRIPEADNRYLRIVILEDGETIHNAFFDRSFKEEDE
jgi:predicted ATPase